MIAYIKGEVLSSEDRSVTISVQGLGYRVFSNNDTLRDLKVGQTAELHTYLAVRENALDLYGFKDKNTLSFFELLITVSGIGPKSAVQILNIATVDSLRGAIISHDTGYLTKVSGIGRKTAEKIVLELKDKIDSIHSESESGNMKEESDALLALMSLGYSERDSRDALKEVGSAISGTSNIVREALKILSN